MRQWGAAKGGWNGFLNFNGISDQGEKTVCSSFRLSVGSVIVLCNDTRTYLCWSTYRQTDCFYSRIFFYCKDLYDRANQPENPEVETE